MRTYTTTDGEVIDFDTGKIVGRAEGAPVAKDPRSAAGADRGFTSGEDAVAGLINNTTWGLQSAFFAIPDIATIGIGKALGMKEEEVQTLGKLFNKFQVAIGGDKMRAPKNATERYARAIGEGIGGGLPFSGILAYAARKAPMVRPGTERLGIAPPSSSVLKDVANEAVDLVKKSPRKALFMDAVFGSAYEGLRQAVEENVDDSDPKKALYKEFMPAAALIGGPLALATVAKLSPTLYAGRKAKQAVDGTGLFKDLDGIKQEVFDDINPTFFKLPGIRILPKFFINRAEQKLESVFGDIAKSPEAQEALAALREVMEDPRIADAGFIFDTAERTLFPDLVQKKLEMLGKLTPNQLASVKDRINQNQAKLEALFESFSPAARKPIEEAFQQVQADRQGFFEAMLREQADLTEAEIVALSERLGPQNIDALNDELRGVLMAGMEMNADMRRNVLSRMGLRQAISPEGLPMPTRENGKSLFESRDMEDAATALIEKYRIERPSLRNQVPEPIRLLERFVEAQTAARQKLESRMLDDLTEQAVGDQISGLPADIQAAIMAEVRNSVRGKASKQGRKDVGLTSVSTKARGPVAEGEIAIPTGIPGRRVIINPTQIRNDAALIARENTKIDINTPEALDYITAAQRFRNDSIGAYNAALMKGRTRLTDAQRLKDTGDAVFRDIEKLVMDHVPKVKREYDGMKMVLDDYKAGYEKALPLLMTSTKRGGQEFLLPNESLMQTAFSNADNLRQLSITLGGGQQAQDLLTRGAVDWLRNKPIFDKNGLVDPKKIRAVLDKNKNIVEALPENIRAKLTDEVGFADDYAKRMAELDQRRIAAKDAELEAVIQKAAREDADPTQSVAKAISDPAVMRKLVNQTRNDPELLASLRRAVFSTAIEGAQKGGALENFIRLNEKSLRVLFKDSAHFEDLKKLAVLQQRANAFASVTGQVPSFQSVDDRLKELFGSGIQYVSTSAREVMSGRISTDNMVIALLVRLSGNLENRIFRDIFAKALEDKTFADRLTGLSTRDDAQKLMGDLQKVGVPRSFFQQLVTGPGAEAAARREITDLALEDQVQDTGLDRRLPVVGTARQMLRSLPSAPPSRGMPPASQGPGGYRFKELKAPAPAAPIQGSAMGMYQALFPNDPISGLLQQRQAGVPPQ